MNGRVIICESPEQCVCVCHKLGYISHGDCCSSRTEGKP